MRGYNFAEYHSDVYDKTESELTAVGLDCECLGGGRIEHKQDQKFIKVSFDSFEIFQFIEHLLRCMDTAWGLVKLTMRRQWRF